jgi:polysaccharide export outer membrane protein
MFSVTRRSLSAALTAVVLSTFACGAAFSQTPDGAYSLATGDRVRVTVYGHEDLSGEFEVDGNGGVALPLIQNVAAAGLSASELEQAITGRLKPDYLKDPRVSVEILSQRPFFILGEVREPGSFPYSSGLTVLKAVALAGGFTYRANTKHLRITREADSRSTELDAREDTEVLPGDVIRVPERFF